jgi:hypothetical protein
MSTTNVAITEQKLLEQAAKRAGFAYLMYVPESRPTLPSGLLYSRPNERVRVRVWNPCANDGDLLYLAAAVPDVDLQLIIAEAAQLEADQAARLAYVRSTFVRAVVDQDQAAPAAAEWEDDAPARLPMPAAPASWWQRLTSLAR